MDGPEDPAPPLTQFKLTEDDFYRRSSQYKNWSFSPSELARLRQKTNQQASERVKANVARQRAQRAKNLDTPAASASESERANTPTAENGSNVPDTEVDCLTADEEMKLVDKFCETALELGKFIGARQEITATTIQFLRRFYIYNSPMTYEGQNIARAVMFIACKTEGWHISASDYAAKFPKVTREMVLAPEHLIIQALRFNFEVRHPFRALKGAHTELDAMVKGIYVPVPWDTRSAAQVREEVLRLPKRAGGAPQHLSENEFRQRLAYDYETVLNILRTVAQLTDAYFLYTTSQIMLAAQLLVDEPLTRFFISAKVPPTSAVHDKLLATIRACADMLAAHRMYTDTTTPQADREAREQKTKEELSAIVKKFKQCRDPDKMDLVKLNEAHKRDAVRDGELDERKAKRRKLDREKAQKEADEFWGGELKKNGDAGSGGGG